MSSEFAFNRGELGLEAVQGQWWEAGSQSGEKALTPGAGVGGGGRRSLLFQGNP